MRTLLLLTLVLIALVVLVILVLNWRFHAQVRAVEMQVLQADARDDCQPAQVPEPVQRVAERAGAGRGEQVRAIRLTQSAEMQMSADQPWQPLSARQVISVTEPGFAWVAQSRVGPINLITVLDAFTAGAGQLRVRFLGAIPLANAEGPDLSLGEAMRYLAELPWAPDAILCNGAIGWSVAVDGWLEARLRLDGQDALVRLRADETGDIVEITATGRPAMQPDGSTALMDWRGVFSDHADMGGRRIPLVGEVGYVEGGQYRPYWRGRITGYELVR